MTGLTGADPIPDRMNVSGNNPERIYSLQYASRGGGVSGKRITGVRSFYQLTVVKGTDASMFPEGDRRPESRIAAAGGCGTE